MTRIASKYTGLRLLTIRIPPRLIYFGFYVGIRRGCVALECSFARPFIRGVNPHVATLAKKS